MVNGYALAQRFVYPLSRVTLLLMPSGRPGLLLRCGLRKIRIVTNNPRHVLPFNDAFDL